MLYNDLGFSSGDLCAAIARGIVHDAAENRLATDGFPEITCSRAGDDFQILLKAGKHMQSLTIAKADARRMVETVLTSEQYDHETFDRIQNAVAELEGDRQK